jgi:transcription elongation factor GreA
MDYFLTEKRFEELKRELEELKTKKRLEVAEKLRQAKELGDLSENSEYFEAREEHLRLEQQIAELEQILKRAVLIKEGKSGREVVEIGATVEVVRDGKPFQFVIVGTNEARPEEGFLSNESPLGAALLGKKVGDRVVVNSPAGEIEYRILKIS